MFFDLNPAPTFRSTVQISQPGGGHRPLTLVFRHKTKSQLDAFCADRQGSDADMAADIVESVPEKPPEMPQEQFFKELFENFPASALDIYLAYVRELREARVKN